MMQYNISPECIVDADEYPDTLRGYLSEKLDLETLLQRGLPAGMLNVLQSNNIGMAANRQFFKNDKQGFLPEILEGLFGERQSWKKKMLTAQKEVERVKKEIERRKHGS